MGSGMGVPDMPTSPSGTLSTVGPTWRSPWQCDAFSRSSMLRVSEPLTVERALPFIAPTPNRPPSSMSIDMVMLIPVMLSIILLVTPSQVDIFTCATLRRLIEMLVMAVVTKATVTLAFTLLPSSESGTIPTTPCTSSSSIPWAMPFSGLGTQSVSLAKASATAACISAAPLAMCVSRSWCAESASDSRSASAESKSASAVSTSSSHRESASSRHSESKAPPLCSWRYAGGSWWYAGRSLRYAGRPLYAGCSLYAALPLPSSSFARH
mmetsp:Transcript_34802/g.112152  ORF Transcript_34802/g.112152 Transcript_34802/m.112152 type:complete len:267 (-) Transcript_34802:150-950(-)